MQLWRLRLTSLVQVPCLPSGMLSHFRVTSCYLPLRLRRRWRADAPSKLNYLNDLSNTYLNKLELPIWQRSHWNLLSCSLGRIPKSGVTWDLASATVPK